MAQRGVAARVAALVRTLQLDEEVVAAEDSGEPRRRVRVADGEPVPGAAGEADEPLVQLLEQRRVERGRQRLATLLRTRSRMCRGEEPAEVRVPLLRLDEQRDVRACPRSGTGKAGTSAPCPCSGAGKAGTSAPCPRSGAGKAGTSAPCPRSGAGKAGTSAPCPRSGAGKAGTSTPGRLR